MSLLGIDVSHHQGEVDWFAVARGNVKFAFAKATEGNAFVDDRFARNWAGMQEAGLLRGAYHFGRPGRDPEPQAAHFASTVGLLGFRDLPPVLDIEEDDGHPAGHVLAWTRAFVEKAEELLGRRLMIYTGAFWRGSLGNASDPFFRERPLWLAGYVKTPTVPASWSKWTLWQYTEGQHNGPVAIPGVRPCDQDRFEGTEEELEALCSAEPVVADEPAPESPGPTPAWPGRVFVWPRTPPVSGPGVKQWQDHMTARGYALTVDGVYGPRSKRACIAFQKDHGLSADGMVGRRTWDACFQA